MLPVHEKPGKELGCRHQPRCFPLQNHTGQERMWPLSVPELAMSQQSPVWSFPCPLHRCQAPSRATAKSKAINAQSTAGCPWTLRLSSSN